MPFHIKSSFYYEDKSDNEAFDYFSTIISGNVKNKIENDFSITFQRDKKEKREILLRSNSNVVDFVKYMNERREKKRRSEVEQLQIINDPMEVDNNNSNNKEEEKETETNVEIITPKKRKQRQLEPFSNLKDSGKRLRYLAVLNELKKLNIEKKDDLCLLGNYIASKNRVSENIIKRDVLEKKSLCLSPEQLNYIK